MSTDHKVLLGSIRRKVQQLFTDETLYTHDVWWRLFEKRDNGIPIEQLRAFGGELDREDLPELVKEAFSDKAKYDSSIVIVDGCIRPEPRPCEARHLYKRTVFATPIPFKATEDEIRDFFKKYGLIEKIDRREWKDHATDKTLNKPGIFVVYKNPESALKCIESRPSYVKTSDVGKYMIPELLVKLRTDSEKSKPDGRLENKYLYKIRDAVEESEDVARLSAEAHDLLQLENIFVVDGAVEGCHWRDIRAFYLKHLKPIKNDVVFTHLNKATQTAYLIIKNVQNLPSIEAERISFNGFTLCPRKATQEDVTYLLSLPVAESQPEATSEEPVSKKPRTE